VNPPPYCCRVLKRLSLFDAVVVLTSIFVGLSFTGKILANRQPLDFAIINGTNLSVVALQAKPNGTQSYGNPFSRETGIGEDGQVDIRPGGTKALHIPERVGSDDDTCIYDFVVKLSKHNQSPNPLDYRNLLDYEFISIQQLNICAIDRLVLLRGAQGQLSYRTEKDQRAVQASPAVQQSTQVAPPAAVSAPHDFENRIRALQQGNAGDYIEVIIPQYSTWSYSRNFYTKSRLYPDHIELHTDPRLRNTKEWELAIASGHIDDNGNGEKDYFSELNPCSSITVIEGSSGHRTQTGIWHNDQGGRLASVTSGKICLENDRLTVRMDTYAETIGGATDMMANAGQCLRGQHGGCILTKGAAEFTFEILPN